MRDPQKSVVLVTGASKGIGRACSFLLSDQGFTVYGTSRIPIEAEAIPERVPSFQMIRFDVTSDQSVQQGFQQILSKEGRLDIVINNAGIGIGGSVEDTSIEEGKHLFDTNFWGVLRVCRAALPVMRSQRAGMIVNVSSLAGLMALPYQGIYSASKFALEGLTEALRMEVKPFGIKVVLVEPGDVITDFTANRVETRDAQRNHAYREQFRKTLGIFEHDEKTGIRSEDVAKLVGRIVNASRPRRRYKVAHKIQRLAAGLNHFLPEGVMEFLVRLHYGLEGRRS